MTEFLTIRIGNSFVADSEHERLCRADTMLGCAALVMARTKTVREDWLTEVDGKRCVIWTRRGAGSGKVLFE